RAYVTQTVSGNARDLRLGAFRERESSDRSTAQIVEGETGDTGAFAAACPRRCEGLRCPRLPRMRIGEDHRRAFWRDVEHRLQWRTDRNDNARASLRLPQPDVCAIVGRPRQAQKVALSLASPQRQQQWQMQMQWCVSEKDGLVIGGPDFVAPRYV